MSERLTKVKVWYLNALRFSIKKLNEDTGLNDADDDADDNNDVKRHEPKEK